MVALDTKMKRASGAFDKRIRSSLSQATLAMAAEQNRHLTQLSDLSTEMNRTKLQHGVRMRQRRDQAAGLVAASLTALAESQWRRTCDSVRKMGGVVGNVSAWNNLLQVDAPITPRMPDPLGSTSPQHDQTPFLRQTETSIESPRTSWARISPTAALQPDFPYPPSPAEPSSAAQDYFGWPQRSSHTATAAHSAQSRQTLPPGPTAKSSFTLADGKLEHTEDRDLTVRAPANQHTVERRGLRMSDVWTTHSLSSSGGQSATSDLRHSNLSNTSLSSVDSNCRKAPQQYLSAGGDGVQDLLALQRGFIIESDEEETPAGHQNQEKDQTISRTSSTTSTSSTRSFVARMRERYQEESAKSTCYKTKVKISCLFCCQLDRIYDFESQSRQQTEHLQRLPIE